MVDPASAPSIGNLAQLLDPIFSAAKGYSNLLIGLGKELLAFAVLAELTMTLFNFWVKGGASDMIAKMVRLFVITALPLMVLTHWPAFPNLIANFFESEIAKLFTSSSGGATDQVKNAIDQLFQAAWGIGEKAAPAATTGSVWSFDAITKAMTHLLIAILVYFPLMFVALALLFALYGPMLMLSIGIIFGPILIAWLPMEAMSQLATKWLNYMIAQGVAFVVGICLSAIIASGLQDFNNVVEAQAGAGATIGAALAGILPMFVGVLFMGYMLFKIEQIAAAMVGGAAIGGGSGFFAFAAGMAAKGMGKGGGSKPSGSGSAGAPGGGSSDGAGSTASSPAASVGSGPSGGSSSQLSSQASQTSSSSASTAVGGSSPGQSASSSAESGSSGLSATAASSGAEAGSPVSAGSQAGDGAGGAPSGGSAASGGGRFAKSMDAVKKASSAVAGSKVLQNKVVQAGAVAAAATAGAPITAMAIGAMAVSPTARAAVKKAGGAMAKAPGALASKISSLKSGGGDGKAEGPSTPATPKT